MVSPSKPRGGQVESVDRDRNRVERAIYYCIKCLLSVNYLMVTHCWLCTLANISVILGNGLGAHLWTDATHLTLPVEAVPVSTSETDENSSKFPNVFTACAVTHARVRAQAGKVDKYLKNVYLPLSDIHVSLSHSELAEAQPADLSLKGHFDQVRPRSEVLNCACG
ncbi:hypothetical protein GOODEAATRI_031876 [Goodea atripinnis]|uniref:Uncharacterized protein n=1 Tax=Goodea atripinnis TaxID=208336 RepID=A0ABV0Q2Q8_9TELE